MCANTNNMRHNFEAAAITCIGVYPYKRYQKRLSGPGIQANISGVDFNVGRVSSGVDIRWHHTKEFKKLSKDHKYELVDWMHSNGGKKLTKASIMEAKTNKRKVSGSGKEGNKKPEGGSNWKKKSKQAIKTPDGLKTVMLVFAEEKKTKKSLIVAFQSYQTTDATTATQVTVIIYPATDPDKPLIGSLQSRFPANSVKIQSILQNNKK